ncbi:MAG: L,D-transpeptidase [Gaiellaceae bacterium]
MRAARHAWGRARRHLSGGAAVVILVVLVVASAGTGAAFAYDRSHRDVIAHGVHVGRIELGGLTAQQARASLAPRLAPLRSSLVLRYSGGKLLLTPRALRLSVEPDTSVVQRALDVSRHSWFLARAWRDLVGQDVKTSIQPRVEYSGSAVAHAIRTLRRRVNRPPRNAGVVPSAKGLTVFQSRPGAKVAVGRLWRELTHTLSTPGAPRVLRVPVVLAAPRLSARQLRRRYPSYIVIDRSAFKLRLYKRLRLVHVYPIAVGQAGLETPAGIYHIQDKAIDPSWHVPQSAWAGSLAGQVIPPGPNDPIKSRWMGIFDGAGIHGTDETWSIGHAVSHGCVRMLIPDVIDLYDRVSVGTPVYIG